MKFITATITSALTSAWYFDKLYSSVEVTDEPVFRKNNFESVPSQSDIFVLKASYLENQAQQGGSKKYLGIKRSSLQFEQSQDYNFEF